MNWISGLQKAIDYIESHLTEELEAADIAAQANYSPYHFQRVFGILCGYSLGEYIRMRRLTLAGSEPVQRCISSSECCTRIAEKEYQKEVYRKKISIAVSVQQKTAGI